MGLETEKWKEYVEGRFAKRHGISQSMWNKAKDEARAILIDAVKIRGKIPYSGLAEKITTIKFAPYDPRLFDLIGEISMQEDDANRGLLSAVVVHKEGDHLPGYGFYEMAKVRGRDVSDDLACWANEVNRLVEIWANGKFPRIRT